MDEWPLHQRLAGIAARTAALAVGLLPGLVGLLTALRWRLNDLPEALMLAAATVAFFAGLLAAERRDGHATLRLAAGAALGALLAPVAFTSLQHLGDFGGAMVGLEGMLRRLPTLLGFALFATVATPLLVPLFAVRARTEAAGPQVAAGVLTVVAVASFGVDEVDRARAAIVLLCLLACGVTAPLALAHAERRWIARWDPAAPRPVEREPRRVLAVYVLLTLATVGASRQLIVRGMRWAGHEPDASWPLRGVPDQLRRGQARNLGELRNDPEGPGIGTGLVGDHVLRLVVSPDGARWAFALDRLAPAEGRWAAHRVFDHTGAASWYPAPVMIDPVACEAPPGGEPTVWPW